MKRMFVIACIAACRISDERVDEEIRKRGGEILVSPPDLEQPNKDLEGNELTLEVHEAPRTSMLPPSIEIGIPILTCTQYCYETVSREFLDGNVVTDPGARPAAGQGAIAKDLTRLAKDGYHPDVSAQNPPGKGKNGACDAGKTGSEVYRDAPHFRDEDFDDGGSFRVYVLVQETCVRCLAPPAMEAKGYLGCVHWAYVKVRHDDRPSTVRIAKLHEDGKASQPSPEFLDALERWNTNTPPP